MRIVAGEYRSRVLKSLSGDNTRPTLDKIKEAIFSRIGPYFDGGNMLDLFGGSGNMGLEAISRGIDHVIFCDSHPQAIQIIKENIRTLCVEKHCDCFKMDYHQMLKKCKEEGYHFDLIYLDPPYRKQQIDEILTLIQDYELLNMHGNVVCETLKEDAFADVYGDIEKRKEAIYGITKITYYQRREVNE